jgi:murein DD-endopeptidase MepM/ murein hydrolase activator NlpD
MRQRMAAAADSAPETRPAPSERRVTTSSTALAGFVLLVVMLVAWGSGMTALLLFGDQLSTRLMTDSAQMQERYEQSLNAYRAEIARMLQELEEAKLTQSDVGQALVKVGRRQREIEGRLQALNRLADLILGARDGGDGTLLTPTPSAPANPPLPPPRQPPRRTEAPALPAVDFAEAAARPVALASDEVPALGLAQAPAPAPAPQLRTGEEPEPSEADEFAAKLDARLAVIDRQQGRIVTAIARLSDLRVGRVRDALTDIGLQPEAMIAGDPKASALFPNITLPISDANSEFARQLSRIRTNYAIIHVMRNRIRALPLMRPTPSDVRYSSPFGYRTHPVLGTKRLHAGLDMAAPVGTPIRAPGSGVVLTAGKAGGYGNMVQIDHGSGLVTRFAHLSEIKVAAGQPVSIGTLIGLMGSTGMSTGSHLHYETRIHGTPQNPACFILAGAKLIVGQSVPYSCDKKPAWRGSDPSEDEDDDN